MKFLATSILATALCVGSTNAAAVFAFEEVGTDVVGTLSGSFDITGAISGFGLTGTAAVDPSFGALAAEVTPLLSASSLSIATGPTSIGSGAVTLATSYIGDEFSIFPTIGLFFDSTYTGGALDGEMILADADFTTLGLDLGTYVYTLVNNDTFTVQVGPAVNAVPLPAALPLLLAGLGGLGGLGIASRRRKG